MNTRQRHRAAHGMHLRSIAQKHGLSSSVDVYLEWYTAMSKGDPHIPELFAGFKREVCEMLRGEQAVDGLAQQASTLSL